MRAVWVSDIQAQAATRRKMRLSSVGVLRREKGPELLIAPALVTKLYSPHVRQRRIDLAFQLAKLSVGKTPR